MRGETRPDVTQSQGGGSGGGAYEARRLPAVPGLDLLGLVEEVVGEVLLAHVAHGVQVLKEPLGREGERERETAAG